jgi:hypothetical protein
MASLISALDNFTPIKVGENGHAELAWSNDIQERICQFDFQCVRTDTEGIEKLSVILDSLLRDLSVKKDDKNADRIQLLSILYKIIGKTRDIEGGKGEYAITYMMIWKWYQYYPELATIALALCVFEPNYIGDIVWSGANELGLPKQVPYGSWKDIKYFCQYVIEQGQPKNHPLILACIRFINSQLRADSVIYHSMDSYLTPVSLSLVSKWIPREGSKYSWLFKSLACSFFPEYMETAKNGNVKLAEKKCMTHYRKLCSMLNRHIDTVQIKQSGNNWAEIDHSKTTSITMVKQRRAFMNLASNQNDKSQRSESEDRIKCAENLKAYIESLKKDGKEVKGKNIGLEVFTSQAMMVMNRDSDERDILNSQWRDNCNKKNANGLGSMIAIVDTSGSMSGDPMNAAIALGCRVAEKSILGKRVMTFSSDPTWINLEHCNTFTEMVHDIYRSNRYAGLSTDFYKALGLILTAIEENRIPPTEVENMVLAVFSDMQIDDNLNQQFGCGYLPNPEEKVFIRDKWATLHEQIKKQYADVGVRLYGVPLKPPHILFWNLRQTDGFPCLSTEANCSMMSGYDPTILNMFCEEGIEALQKMTPYNNLVKQLDNERYAPLETIIMAHTDTI